MKDYSSDIVTTYRQMRWWRDQFFAENGPRFVVVIGSPGTAKSTLFREGGPSETLRLGGALSAFHFYTELWNHVDQPVVIDDVDSLFRDKSAINLLKCVCNTDSARTVYWGKRNKQLEDEGIPTKFVTTSRVAILANSLASIEANLAAVLDRAFVIHFEPPVCEVHAEVGNWFKDDEVYEFIGSHLPFVVQPSMRLYVKASDLRRLGTDWKGWLIRQWTANDPKLGIVAQIMADATLTSAEQRVSRFHELSGGSRATFMRKQAEWRKLMGRLSRDAA